MKRNAFTLVEFVVVVLAGVESKVVADTNATLLMGDGEPSDDPNVSLQGLPPRWIDSVDSPVRRHLETGNYLFVDGHVKSLRPQRIVTPEPKAVAPTFLVR